MKIRVLVRPKAGILDPQGEAVRSALPALGFEGVQTVHVQMEEYLDVREDPRRFVVLRDHVVPHVERVVSSTDGYVVVEKSAAVSEITEATDPNA